MRINIAHTLIARMRQEQRDGLQFASLGEMNARLGKNLRRTCLNGPIATQTARVTMGGHGTRFLPSRPDDDPYAQGIGPHLLLQGRTPNLLLQDDGRNVRSVGSRRLPA
jgi:hypothetical protein